MKFKMVMIALAVAAMSGTAYAGNAGSWKYNEHTGTWHCVGGSFCAGNPGAGGGGDGGDGGDGGNGGSANAVAGAVGVGVGVGVGGSATGGSATVGDVTTGSVGNVGNNSKVRNLSPEAKVDNHNTNTSVVGVSSKVDTTDVNHNKVNTTDVNMNSNKQGQHQGQLQGQQQSIKNSGNSSATGGSVSGVTATGNSGTIQGGAGGSATIEQGAVSNTVSTGSQSTNVSTEGTVGDVTTGSQSQSTNVSTEGTVGDVTTGEQTNSQSTSIVMGDNQYTVDAARAAADAQVEAARIAAEAGGTRDLTDAQQRELDRQAALRIAEINSEQTIKNTPSVDGPPLTSSNDTCMGSTSGSVNVPGFGMGLGTTWTDDNCVMLKNSRELWNMGMKAAALALMCTDKRNREALEVTGYKCPAKKEEANPAPDDPSLIGGPNAGVRDDTGTYALYGN